MAGRGWRLAAATALVAVPLAFIGASAAPAGAAASITGPCTGSGAFRTGTKAKGPFTVSTSDFTKDPSLVVEVPLRDVVSWQGGVASSGRRTISGHVRVTLPPPFPDVPIDSWGKSTTRTSNSGQHAYSLPSSMPRNVEFRVYGAHTENGSPYCSGYVDVKIEGSAFDTPWPFVSLGLTGLALLALAAAGIPVFVKLWAQSDATP